MFNLPNLITSGNFLCGILSILCASSGQMEIAIALLFIALVLDFADGFVARKLNMTTEFGKQLDSLADIVSFGVAPGVLMFITIRWSQHDANVLFRDLADASQWYAFAAMSIPFFSLFRLAKFNLDLRQTDKFIGIPTPLNTLFFLFFPLYSLTLSPEMAETSPWFLNPVFMASLSLFFPLLLIANIPLIALKFSHFAWKGNEFRYALLAISLITILFLQMYALPIIVLLYLLLSFIDHFITKNHEIQS